MKIKGSVIISVNYFVVVMVIISVISRTTKSYSFISSIMFDTNNILWIYKSCYTLTIN